MTKKTHKLLIVDDDVGIRKQLKWTFDRLETLVAEDRKEALTIARREEPQVVLLDLAMPPDLDGPSEGFAALDELLALNPKIRVIIASGNDERGNALKAIRRGAYDFCAKPVDIAILNMIVDRAFYLYDLEAENERLSGLNSHIPLDGLITACPKMLQLCKAVEQVASSGISVMLTGESGTGKEVMARSLHRLSPRVSEKFIAINCAAIPENLLESELFGHEKGAFTGAVNRTIGKFETANKGILFLDEIAEMPPALQAKLLRFLQDRSIERVGGRESIKIDVRIISATNKDLKAEMASGHFREDLYYRLNEVAFHLPPLRERKGDAALLSSYFIQLFNKTLNTHIKGLTADATAAVNAYAWPGNIRELENRIKRAMVLCHGKYLNTTDLDLEPSDENTQTMTLRQAREKAEKEIVTQALAQTQDNVSQSAKILGVSRPTLYELMKNLGLKA